jgi:hypothetical protein
LFNSSGSIMKNNRIHSAIIILALTALNFTTVPRVRADQQTREQAIALLTSGIWHFAGVNWSNDRVFDPKGRVLVQASNANGIIKWKMDSKQVTIIFEDHDDVMFLPIDPKGTKAMDQHGNDVIATQIPGSTNASAPATGAPSALSALKPLVPGAAAPPTTAQLLTAKKWHFAGASWEEERTFDPNGTMTIENNANVARWQVTAREVVMTFKDHKDILYLPLDPKGTKGMDAYGRLIIATQGVVPDSVPATTSAAQSGAGAAGPSSGSSYFGTKQGQGLTPPSPTPLQAPPSQ